MCGQETVPLSSIVKLNPMEEVLVMEAMVRNVRVDEIKVKVDMKN